MPTLNDEGLIVLDKKIELLPYKPRPFIQRKFLTDAEIMTNAGGTLFIDVELYPNYFLLGCKLHTTNKFLTLESSEDRGFNPQFLSWLMHNYRTVGFNSITFDLLIIWLAYHTQDTSILKDAANDLILGGMREWELKKNYQFQTFKTNHIDLIEVAPLRKIFNPLSLVKFFFRLASTLLSLKPLNTVKKFGPADTGYNPRLIMQFG